MTVGRGNLPGFDFESPCYGEQMAAARRGKAATSGPAAVKRTVSGEPSTEECGAHSGVSNRVLGGCGAGLGVQKPRAAKRLVLPVKVLTRLRLETGNDPRIGSSNG